MVTRSTCVPPRRASVCLITARSRVVPPSTGVEALAAHAEGIATQAAATAISSRRAHSGGTSLRSLLAQAPDALVAVIHRPGHIARYARLGWRMACDGLQVRSCGG